MPISVVVEHVLRLRMQRRVDGDDVADRTIDSTSGWKVEAQLLLDVGGQAVAVGVVQVHVERLQTAQHGGADAAGGDGADVHALEVVRARDEVGDVPAARCTTHLVGRDVVADEREDHHDDVLADTDAVRVGDLGNGDAALRWRPAGRCGRSRCRR